MRLQDIADQLGYASKSSVTNLMGMVWQIEPYSRSITLGDDYRETHVDA